MHSPNAGSHPEILCCPAGLAETALSQPVGTTALPHPSWHQVHVLGCFLTTRGKQQRRELDRSWASSYQSSRIHSSGQPRWKGQLMETSCHGQGQALEGSLSKGGCSRRWLGWRKSCQSLGAAHLGTQSALCSIFSSSELCEHKKTRLGWYLSLPTAD